MTRAALRALLLYLTAMSVACSDDTSEADTVTTPPPSAQHALPAYYPLAAGDRWRLHTRETEAVRMLGVTGVEDTGVAVVFGTGHAMAERYRATAEEVALVDPDGQTLVPLLRAPLTEGARFDYALSERDVQVPCDVEVARVDVEADVAGTQITDCIEVVRTCRYPAGSPFPQATTHRVEERYCPGVGRVREVGTFDPAPRFGALPGLRTVEVRSFRVAGGPLVNASGCAGFLLLPTDVQTACGAQLQPTDPVVGRDEDGVCTYRYRNPEGAIEVSARGSVDPAATRQWLSETGGEPADRGGARVSEGTDLRVAVASRRHELRVRADTGVCRPEGALRLVPLLRSLVDDGS